MIFGWQKNRYRGHSAAGIISIFLRGCTKFLSKLFQGIKRWLISSTYHLLVLTLIHADLKFVFEEVLEIRLSMGLESRPVFCCHEVWPFFSTRKVHLFMGVVETLMNKASYAKIAWWRGFSFIGGMVNSAQISGRG